MGFLHYLCLIFPLVNPPWLGNLLVNFCGTPQANPSHDFRMWIFLWHSQRFHPFLIAFPLANHPAIGVPPFVATPAEVNRYHNRLQAAEAHVEQHPGGAEMFPGGIYHPKFSTQPTEMTMDSFMGHRKLRNPETLVFGVKTMGDRSQRFPAHFWSLDPFDNEMMALTVTMRIVPWKLERIYKANHPNQSFVPDFLLHGKQSLAIFALVGGLEHFLFSHILGIIIPID